MFKRFIAVVAGVAVALALVACAGPASGTKSADAAPAASAAPAAAAAAPAAAKIPAGEAIALDGFEDGQYWEIDTSVKDGLIAEVQSEKGVVEGSNALSFMFKPTTWALIKTNMLEVNDWSGAKAFVFDVLNDSDKTVEMGICIMDGDNWEWQQTPSVIIPPGKQTFVGNLTDGTFLSTKGGVHAVPAPNGAANIAYCAIVVHKAEKETTVYIDNIRLIK